MIKLLFNGGRADFKNQTRSQSKYLQFILFSGSRFCCWEELLNWLKKNTKLTGGLKKIELF